MRSSVVVGMTGTLLLAALAGAQEGDDPNRVVARSETAAPARPSGPIQPSFRDADLAQIAQAVGDMTGKRFVLDPRVCAQVNFVADRPLSPDELYEWFQAVVHEYGFIALEEGDTVEIIPDESTDEELKGCGSPAQEPPPQMIPAPEP